MHYFCQLALSWFDVKTWKFQLSITKAKNRRIWVKLTYLKLTKKVIGKYNVYFGRLSWNMPEKKCKLGILASGIKRDVTKSFSRIREFANYRRSQLIKVPSNVSWPFFEKNFKLFLEQFWNYCQKIHAQHRGKRYVVRVGKKP